MLITVRGVSYKLSSSTGVFHSHGSTPSYHQLIHRIFIGFSLVNQPSSDKGVPPWLWKLRPDGTAGLCRMSSWRGAFLMGRCPWHRCHGFELRKTPWKILELLRNGKHEFSSPFMSIQCEPLKPLKISLHTSELKYTSDTHQIGPIYPHFSISGRRSCSAQVRPSSQLGSRRRATVNLRKTGITARALTIRRHTLEGKTCTSGFGVKARKGNT